ncbi:hemerythrin domain-containing protein [Kitasatospora sp. NPDC057223]|jgi:hemerythrin-like domain-containing protein|uniref:hemerythrin domain-containing protein n=1 Tax=Kitasatospora sp. NPDC057223 TaxID=3346055 RepID=UPI0036355AAF
MGSKDFKLDMTMMFAMHDALRRELERMARVTARVDGDPRSVLTTAVGWEMFKTFLTVHHTAEDVMIWPVMQQALAGRPDDLELLDAMEAEHAAIDPLLTAIDAALADHESGAARLGDLSDALVTTLTTHLKHEESDALRLIDATLSEEQWKNFSAEHRGRIGDNAPRFMPWLLDEASEENFSLIVGRMPENLQAAYENEWRRAYQALNLWGPGGVEAAR